MTVSHLLSLLRECPIIASAQASEGSALDDPQTLLKLAQASIQQGVRVLRLQGVENINVIKGATGLPVMGLIKRHYPDSDTYITPTMHEVDELLRTDCEIIGIDSVIRRRPGDCQLADLIAAVHRAGRLVLADVDTAEAAKRAVEAGADLVSSTLHGYTDETRGSGSGPGLNALREMCEAVDVPVFAEGRYAQEWHVQAAMRIGAVGVVMGSALNDTFMQTKKFVRAAATPTGSVGAADIGGTWLRFAVFSDDWQLLSSEKVALPVDPEARLNWIRSKAAESGVCRLGVSTGGVVDPRTGTVVQAKDLIPGHAGVQFNESTLGLPTGALNDGLASAWGHACHPAYAGKRVATLALGTGVGFGIVDQGRLLTGPSGAPPHLNDLPWNGSTIEEALGGAALESGASDPSRAKEAFRYAMHVIHNLYFPDATVICGSVGLSDLLPSVERSPFGSDAGLYGAAALALWPPTHN